MNRDWRGKWLFSVKLWLKVIIKSTFVVISWLSYPGPSQLLGSRNQSILQPIKNDQFLKKMFYSLSLKLLLWILFAMNKVKLPVLAFIKRWMNQLLVVALWILSFINSFVFLRHKCRWQNALLTSWFWRSCFAFI